MNYEEHVHRRLQEVSERAQERDLELESARLVIFSDHHRGQRDDADDFRRCERAYHAALGYYLEMGYTLITLGDVEELWECRPKCVVEAYKYSLELEAEFYKDKRYVRIVGNHDDEWESARSVKYYLGRFFQGIAVPQGLRYNVKSGTEAVGKLFMVHGHQGTTWSDRHKNAAKFAVRWGWRPIQRLFNIRLTTPARDFALRGKHDLAMIRWAEGHKVVLIAGHTHRPVFESMPHHLDWEKKLAQAKEAATGPSEQVAQIRAKLEWIMAQNRDVPSRSALLSAEVTPCYFNSGCCSFADGDVTGLEIAGGEIALVRWPNNDREPLAERLAHKNLGQLFAAL